METTSPLPDISSPAEKSGQLCVFCGYLWKKAPFLHENLLITCPAFDKLILILFTPYTFCPQNLSTNRITPTSPTITNLRGHQDADL